ncbi:MAG: glycosyltransferase family 2 protein [Armatimonadetes bacterium]|nr:glycosyltransferase family 2 protein [Armatimonadota bacterium]
MRVSVIIPALNEEDALARVLADLPRDLVSEVVVVDGGSTDRTREVAQARGARVIQEPRRGYGQACLTGLARVSHPDVVVFLDGDYSDRPAELPRLLAPLASGQADLVIGSRLRGDRQPGALGWHAVVGNRVAVALMRLLFGVQLSDLGPFRAARYAALLSLGLRETRYGWPVEMVARGHLHGLRIVEVPVSYHPRIGRSKITGTVRGTVLAALHMLACMARILSEERFRRSGGRTGVSPPI